MNREILFRVWGKDFEEYFYDIAIFSDGTLFIKFDENGYDDVGLINDIENDFILEQFTGLKDKNGKKIFEGDRVKFYEEYDGKILYRIGGFFFEDRKGWHTTLQLLNPIYCEVIGNIHEEEVKE